MTSPVPADATRGSVRVDPAPSDAVPTEAGRVDPADPSATSPTRVDQGAPASGIDSPEPVPGTPDSDADPFEPALAALLPGAGLAAVVESLDPTTTSDADVVEVVAAAARLEAWAHAVAARWAGVLARRPGMHPVWSSLAGPVPAQDSVAGDELALRLAVSRRRGAALVAEGVAYDGALVATGEALAAGRIDAARAAVVVERLSPLPLQVTVEVEDRVLPGAGRRTVEQLCRDVERAVVAVGGAEAAVRHARARVTRRVEHPRVLPDGMASLRVVMTAADAVRVDTVLGAAAKSARTCGDPRTLDQLRADGLRDLVVGGPASGPGPAVGPGPGPGVAGGGAAGVGGGLLGGARGRVRASIRVVVPLSTLMGLDEGPGELAGYGPIDAVQARALAAGGVWRRLVTDPLSGAVLDVGRTSYRPPAALAEHVRARDRRCARPGCLVDADSCDLDHTVEFHPDGRSGAPPGTTGAGNLGPLCRRDHRLKTDGGFTLRQVDPGVYEWTTPAGHRYRVRPGTDEAPEHMGHLDGPAPPF
ncbi:MAG TPA: DUF222 domain-containing protein [Cellulomonas sp.]